MGGHWFSDKTYQQLVNIGMLEEVLDNSPVLSDLLQKSIYTSFIVKDDEEAELQCIQWYALEEHS